MFVMPQILIFIIGEEVFELQCAGGIMCTWRSLDEKSCALNTKRSYTGSCVNLLLTRRKMPRGFSSCSSAGSANWGNP